MPVRLMSDEQVAMPIRCVITDVDGVLTDGRIIYDNSRMETKAFHVRDGLAIKLWTNSGFAFGILTARSSQIVAHRAQELGVQQLRQGVSPKLPGMLEMIGEFGCTADQVCYIGDDLPDIPVMRRVGLAVAPADAANDARDAAHWILSRRGGDGAVRELIERLLRAKQRWEEHVPG